MIELALNILDIATNSVKAEASLVEIIVEADTASDLLRIVIKDDGKGMSEEFVKNVTDPFTTTRTTRKVGLGIPLFKQAAEDAGGEFLIESELGKGTTVTTTYKISSVDRMPLGDLAGSIVTLIGAKSEIDYVLDYSLNGNHYVFDTREVKMVMDGLDIAMPEISCYIRDMIDENLENINGGISL